jgi:hypothetical protein
MCPTHHAAQTQPIVRSSDSGNGQSPRPRTSSFSTVVFPMSRANASRAIEAPSNFIDKTRGVEILIKHQALAQNGQICDFSRLG